ncbi:hypothetical protein ABFS82_04G089900 [Erythranthe guttata]|uniref:Nuclease associated modular domain-containing protein n=1 Tax=Erythranthe guttata TaxID=4155 RepID=A0A022S3Q2_ERYGU|nr:PREDICTED: uncharacterized protein LOC105953846 [Erythranthe guttata]EYU45920.1 hypothetical protein MIMGU_mgv1a003936mg [Erythranthe guttata]|eukprot:XP_012833012.1 PREDICTED: uncharacterized protein LOC105953846 [Erythranthe guttata]
MPLLDIATSQACSCFLNNILAFRTKPNFHNRILVKNDRVLELGTAFSWKSFCVTEKLLHKNSILGGFGLSRGRLTINAVATLENPSVAKKNEGVKPKGCSKNMLSNVDIDSVSSNSTSLEPQKSSCEESSELNDREVLRRMRISKANSGKTPWNKGRKHSPETLQRIKERTRLAMQNPKVKMKLQNLGHAQSDETRIRIGVGVRLGWGRRREKLMVQETCHHKWQDLIAQAAQKGLFGEEELQWDSYKTMDEHLEQEWQQSVEERKNNPRAKGSKRAPKSPEQKRKIAEAISAKWADPDYRNRVCSGLAKFYGISERVERKPRIIRQSGNGDGQARKRRSTNKDENFHLGKRETKGQVRSKRRKPPLYKDPFASSKLEMLKNIRAQRASSVSKKSEAISMAKLMIAEAEKATEALEIASKNSPSVHASLIESRLLIAEAIQFMKSIENDDEEDPIISSENGNGNCFSEKPIEVEGIDSDTRQTINGVHSLVNGKTSCNGFHSLGLENETSLFDSAKYAEESRDKLFEEEEAEKQVKVIKKWVAGRLVEVVEET